MSTSRTGRDICTRPVAENAARVNQEERRDATRRIARIRRREVSGSALSGKGWLRVVRGWETEKWKGIMGRDGLACRSLENYDSSFSGAERVLGSCSTFESLDPLFARSPYRAYVCVCV